MRIGDLQQQHENSLAYDIVDDCHVHMKNDPSFYRSQYFPTMSKCADAHRAGLKVNPMKIIAPMVEKGINSYCKKYNLAKHPDELFTKEIRDSIIDKIFAEEIDEIKKGEYK